MWTCQECGGNLLERTLECPVCGARRVKIQPQYTSSLTRRRRIVGIWIGLIHFCIAITIVLSMLAMANYPVPPAGSDWIVIPFFIFLFPASLLGIVGAYSNDLIALLLVPITSVIWGWALACLFVPTVPDQ